MAKNYGNDITAKPTKLIVNYENFNYTYDAD